VTTGEFVDCPTREVQGIIIFLPSTAVMLGKPLSKKKGELIVYEYLTS
jgi:hypothetical protein